MTSASNEKIYNIALISKIKEQTGPKKLKKIIKNLRNLAEEDLKEFSDLKIKVFKEEKKQEAKIAAPILGLRHYFEDFKKSNSKKIVNNDTGYERKNTPSTVNDSEEGVEQIDSSDFSEDE